MDRTINTLLTAYSETVLTLSAIYSANINNYQNIECRKKNTECMCISFTQYNDRKVEK